MLSASEYVTPILPPYALMSSFLKVGYEIPKKKPAHEARKWVIPPHQKEMEEGSQVA